MQNSIYYTNYNLIKLSYWIKVRNTSGFFNNKKERLEKIFKFIHKQMFTIKNKSVIMTIDILEMEVLK